MREHHPSGRDAFRRHAAAAPSPAAEAVRQPPRLFGAAPEHQACEDSSLHYLRLLCPRVRRYPHLTLRLTLGHVPSLHTTARVCLPRRHRPLGGELRGGPGSHEPQLCYPRTAQRAAASRALLQRRRLREEATNRVPPAPRHRGARLCLLPAHAPPRRNGRHRPAVRGPRHLHEPPRGARRL